MTDGFKISSFNCNGLSDTRKRQDVFDFLRRQKSNIFLLQETHLKQEMEKYIRAGWGYTLFLAGSDTNKNGVCILFQNNFEYKIHNVLRDPAGCYLILDMELLGKRLSLINVYGPSSGDNPAFFDMVFGKIQQIGNEHIVIGGDWNCVLNMNTDARNYTSTVNRPRTRAHIKSMMNELELVDIWREYHPDKRAYTWRRFNSIKQSRLDYFLISESLQMDIEDCTIGMGYRSDHSLVNISIRTEQFKRDRPYWKFNNSLLKDKEYIDEIKKVILNIKSQYAASPYNTENIQNIPNEFISFVITDQLFFETLLFEIRGKSISYASFKKKRETDIEKRLTKEISFMEKNINHSVVDELEEKKNQLKDLREKRVEGMYVRSRVRWVNEGEKVSRYFCNLENRHYVNKAMTFLESADGERLHTQKDILYEVKTFYEELYSHREVQDIDLHNILHDVPILSQEQSDSLEGALTYEEALKVLKGMKNFKSPGSDGFTVEFFKFFFQDVGHFLVRSINEGLTKGQLSVTQRQGVITCIPKEGKPRHLIKNWRPISLLNVAYKIGSACIAQRLQKVLPSIVHSSQKGFIKGRYIGDNIRLLYDVLLHTEKEKLPGLLLMIDFEKAFDSVSWTFLERALVFFNFPQCIVHWFKALYSNILACVHVNGQYSEWFSVQRGCRQGDPVSPYFYIICAEVLSLLIRKNNIIKGIKLRDRDALLSLFADDTTCFLDGSEKSFIETVRLMDFFSQLSGLKMNNEKTQVVWIGSRRNCGIRYMTDRNFQWDPGIFRILGVNFSTDTGRIAELNYDGKLEEVKTSLCRWKKRQLTPIGKVTVLKTLILSKLTYLFINLPDPPAAFLKQLENMLFQFLWDGKCSRIKKSVVCKPLAEGGLGMCNIYAFLASLKISCLRRLMSGSSEDHLIFSVYPELGRLKMFGSEYANVVMQKTGNPFWIDVMKHYRKLCLKSPPVEVNEFLGESIQYNIHITVEKRVIFLKEWVDVGVLHIKDLVGDDGKLLNYQQFKQRHPAIARTNFLTYEGIALAIKRYCVQSEINPLLLSRDATISKVWFCIEKGNKQVKNVLCTSNDTPTAVGKWNTLYQNLHWKTIFLKCISLTVDTQLRWFQARLIHRIIATKKYLFKCKLAENDLCAFCDQETETIQHIFWQCHYVKEFWDNLLSLIKEKCVHCERFLFNEELIIFNTCNTISTDSAMGYIILTAKFFIYKCKLKGDLPRINQYINFLKTKYTVEKYTSIVNCTHDRFRQRWFLYQPLLCVE